MNFILDAISALAFPLGPKLGYAQDSCKEDKGRGDQTLLLIIQFTSPVGAVGQVYKTNRGKDQDAKSRTKRGDDCPEEQ